MVNDLTSGYGLLWLIGVLIVIISILVGHRLESKENRWFWFIALNLALFVPTAGLFSLGFIPTFVITRWRHKKHAPPPQIVKLNLTDDI